MALKKEMVLMPEQNPKIRRYNFQEVPLGYTQEMAMEEARRCLQCKNPTCIEGCPVNIDIKSFIRFIKEGNFKAAIDKIKETNSLPAVTGRVCPQESQCQAKCVLGRKFEPCAIGRLERFVADWERQKGEVTIPEIAKKTGKKVAVIGSGPAGLTVAGDLIKLGHDVTIFEALHKPGGVLVYGIPEFRLPKAIVYAEVAYLQKLGVNLETDEVIGRTSTIDELLGEEGYDTVFVGTGAGAPRFLKLAGENLNGVFSANEYLTRCNLMKAYLFPDSKTPIKLKKRVAVIGGGNVAMDSARTALRLGAEHSIIVYRRAREQMPARDEEIHHAHEEGVEFHLLTNPIRFIGNERRELVAMECIKMELGEPDDSGRRRPVAIEGSEFILEVDSAIIAVGNYPNPLIGTTTPDLDIHPWGTIKASEETGETSIKGVYAGGDVVTGAATVISAMGAAKCAAEAMHRYLMGHED